MEKLLDRPVQLDTRVNADPEKTTQNLEALLEDTWLSNYFTDAKPHVG